MKIGKTLNLSFPPGCGCIPNAPCAKDCYARKAWRCYPNVRKSWKRNWDLWQADPAGFEHQVQEALEGQKPAFFRWFVSGDVPDERGLGMVVRMAYMFPNVWFMLFTKQHAMVVESFRGGPVPKNLKIVLSMWPGMKNPRTRRFARAWMQDGTETRVPASAATCPGSCEECRACWGWTTDVVFKKH